MLPNTFIADHKLRASQAFIGIFAVVILTAGFTITALLTCTVRNPLFQADVIFLPSLMSCGVGLLTVFYSFLINSRYVWNTAAILTTVAASVSTVVYATVLLRTHRKSKTRIANNPAPSMQSVPLRAESIASTTGGTSLWQDPAYYENYVRNMFPTSAHPPAAVHGYDASLITEEEMTRQQMLMLLLPREQRPDRNTPNPSESTFRIEWQGQDQEELQPAHGFYAQASASTPGSAYPLTAISRQFTNELRPWDGVWRGPAQVQGRGRTDVETLNARSSSQERREQRRREIEMGRR